MEIPIIEGRNFRPDDGDVYIFNEAARNKYPIIKINEKAGGYPVIGICKNIRYSSFRNNDYSQPLAFLLQEVIIKTDGGNGSKPSMFVYRQE